MIEKNAGPALTLKDLSTAWLKRRITRLEGMPGLNNAAGSVQMDGGSISGAEG